MIQFPAYQTEETARNWGCFGCCSKLTEQMTDSEYPVGKWMIKCSHCGFTNYFDLRDEA